MAIPEEHILPPSPDAGSLPTTESVSESLTSGDTPATTSGRAAQIAVCGIGVRLPGGIRTCDDYWDLLFHGRDARGPVPSSRYNAQGFNSSLGGKDGMDIQHGYFLDGDLGALDTSFFRLTKSELEKTDPQQRMLLEVTRECLEDAAEVDYSGRAVGCYVGTFGDDGLLMASKGAGGHGGGYSVTGAGDLMLANRVSYEYNFRGPSMAIKTGCSASLVALHEACRALQHGDATSAVVAGTSVIMTPMLTATMASLGLLSPEASCKSFDAAADGFARAEAVTAVYIKPLEDAIRDGNPIRAVIRATGTNSDGTGQGLVTPNGPAQEALIRKAYDMARLDPKDTAYVECHGTGTPTGDPIETTAVGSVFGDAGIYIGSVKPNLGHSEGSSGLSSLIKCVLALEHKTIPPNIKFNSPNPKIPFEMYKLKVPTSPTPLPEGRAERISINSFGIGGTNAHVILESWDAGASHTASPVLLLDDSNTNSTAACDARPLEPTSELLLLSANTEKSLAEQTNRFKEYLRLNPGRGLDVAYTRAFRREHLLYRGFGIIQPSGEVSGVAATAVRIPVVTPSLTMVFSGQGAQWPEMGKELILTDVEFRRDLEKMDSVLGKLAYPPKWKLLDELLKPKETSQIHKAEVAQPLSTALQLALVNRYTALGLAPASVVGHSSGEIAAAYVAGHISAREAIIMAYYRGYVMAKQTLDGGMAAVGLGSKDLGKFLRDSEVVIACENSPNSSTISGARDKVLEVIAEIQRVMPETFVRLLKVDMAYHSHHMAALSDEYRRLLEEAGLSDTKTYLATSGSNNTTALFSSVTSQLIPPNTPLGPSYWIQNLTSPVRFSAAVSCLLTTLHNNSTKVKRSPVLLEVGPHSTLAGPLRQIFASHSSTAKAQTTSHTYISALSRDTNSRDAFLASIGSLYQSSIPMDLTALFPTSKGVKAIPNLPTYPWDHTSASLWAESRISRDWRKRAFPTHCLLGIRVPESAGSEPVWRHVLRLEDEPWLGDHKIQSDVVFPFAGYVAMAGEAVRQIYCGVSQEEGYRLRHVVVHAALLMPTEGEVEVVTSLKRAWLNDGDESKWWEFTVSSFGGGGSWTRHCVGRVAVGADKKRAPAWKAGDALPRSFNKDRMYGAMAKAGFLYGPAFRGLSDVTSSTTEEMAIGRVILPTDLERDVDDVQKWKDAFTLHPTTIDACLQLLLAAKSKGLGRSVLNLSVPTAIEELEIAQPTGSQLYAKAWNDFGRRDKPVIECQEDGNIVFRADGLRLRPIADDSDKADKSEEDVHAAARLHWMPDFDFIDHATLFRPPEGGRDETQLQEELVLLFILESARRLRDLTPSQPHFAKFRDWLSAQVEIAAAGTYELVPQSRLFSQLPSADLIALIDTRITQLQGMSRVALTTGLKRIFDNIRELFTGEADTLDTLLEDQLLARIYDVTCFDYADFIRTLSHARPQLRILEVGAGTGGTTETILRSLSHVAGLPSYACYTFTDISAGFFPAAQERFSYAPNLEFKVLDISRDPREQGFEPGIYDLILASNVVHATPRLQETLRNLSWLLKSDGMLAMTEICTLSRGGGFIFGNFSGWWLGEADGRVEKPHVGIDRWHADLQASGFNGVDSVLYDEEEEAYRQCAVIVSRKAEGNGPDTEQVPKKVALLTTAPESATTSTLTTSFREGGWSITQFGLADPSPEADTDVVVLLDFEDNFFESITPDTLASFQRLLASLSSSQTVLWLTPPTQIACTNPRTALSVGIARTIRSELALRFATLEIDPSALPANEFSAFVSKVFNKVRTAPDTDTLESDKEFAVHNRTIHIGRYHPFSLVDEVAEHSTSPRSSRSLSSATTATGDSQAAILNIVKPGVLDSLTWEAITLPSEVPRNHVEVAVHYSGLNFRDVVLAGGLIPSAASPGQRLPLAMEVSGVVTRVGPGQHGDADDLKVGDRVMAFSHTGGFVTKTVAPSRHVLRLPDSLSLAQAATMQAVYATVIYALLDVGRLRRGMSVLVHSACGGVGLAAMELITRMFGDGNGDGDGGVTLYCTVGAEGKVEHLVQRFGVPRERIFSSRDAAFLDKIMAVTNGNGVDLVMNSLSGELLHTSWRCVARGGQLLELGKRDLVASAKLDMALFLEGRSYCGIDLAYLCEHQEDVTTDLRRRALALYRQGLIAPIEPVKVFEALDVKRCFRQLQAGDHIGKFILKMPEDHTTLNPVSMSSSLSFFPNAAYLLVGGAGGLGRSLAIWLAERGAKQLVFLSRGLGTSRESLDLTMELQSMGCAVTMVTGSVNCIDDVNRTIVASAAPIKGVFQLAMVQRDAPFISVSWPEWKAVLEPKMVGTWNLHRAFLASSEPLDHFWLASSIATVADQPGQGSYKAGCLFVEAFCQYRHSLSLPASVLTICPIDEVGFVAENVVARRSTIAQGMHMLGEREFLESVEASLLVGSPPSSPTAAPSASQGWQSRGHIIMGLRSASDFPLDDDRNITNWRRDRRMGLYHNRTAGSDAQTDESKSSSLRTFIGRLSESGSDGALKILDDAMTAEFLAIETGNKVYDFLLKPGTPLDMELSLTQMGLDSLTAIELRRWFRQAMGLQVTVLELMGSSSLRGLGKTLAAKLKERFSTDQSIGVKAS